MNPYKWLYLVVLWMIYWLGVSGTTVYVLPHFLNADQFNNSWILCIHFAFFAVISAIFFRVHESLPHLTQMRWQILSILVLAVAFVGLTSLYDTSFILNDKARESIMRSRLFYPLFSVQTTTPKVFDIIFQQITIFGFIKYLLSRNFEKKHVLLTLWLAFACIHTPLMLLGGIYWVTLVVPSLFAGLLFSYTILKFKYGLASSFALHFLFYFSTGIALRTFYSH